MGGFSSLGVIPFVRLGLGSRLWGMLMPVGPAFKLVSCRSPVLDGKSEGKWRLWCDGSGAMREADASGET